MSGWKESQTRTANQGETTMVTEVVQTGNLGRAPEPFDTQCVLSCRACRPRTVSTRESELPWVCRRSTSPRLLARSRAARSDLRGQRQGCYPRLPWTASGLEKRLEDLLMDRIDGSQTDPRDRRSCLLLGPDDLAVLDRTARRTASYRANTLSLATRPNTLELVLLPARSSRLEIAE
jgi:hypothetical protein